MNKVLEYIIGAKDKTGNAISSAWGRIKSFASNVLGKLANIKAGFDMAISAGRKFAGLFAGAIKEAFKFEKAHTDFAGLLNSIDKAKDHIADLRQFASSTPLTFGDLSQASKLLLSFGMDVKDVMPSMKMLGDIAMGDSQKFQGLALVFAQVKSAGKLMGQDLLQMINQGFNPLTVISQKTGKSVSELKDIMAEGGISFEMVAESMRLATSEGGLFNNAMANAAQTGEGLISTLQDKWTDVVRTFGEAFTETAKGGLSLLIEKLTQLVEDGTVDVWANKVARALNEVMKHAESCAKAISWVSKAVGFISDVTHMAGASVGAFLGELSVSGSVGKSWNAAGDAAQKAVDQQVRRDELNAASDLAARKAGIERAANKKVLDERKKQTKSLNEMLVEAETNARLKAEKKVATERDKLMRAQIRKASKFATKTSSDDTDAQSRLKTAKEKVEDLWKYYEDPDGWRKYEEEVVGAQRKRNMAKERFNRDYAEMQKMGHSSLTDGLTQAMANALQEERDAEQYAKETAEAAKKAAENLERLNQHFEEGKAE